MAETEQENKTRPSRNFHWSWLPGILFQPRKTISKILEQEKAVWKTPLIVISILVILAGGDSGPHPNVSLYNPGPSCPKASNIGQPNSKTPLCNHKPCKPHRFFSMFSLSLSAWRLLADLVLDE